jgi:hypothetical protein
MDCIILVLLIQYFIIFTVNQVSQMLMAGQFNWALRGAMPTHTLDRR